MAMTPLQKYAVANWGRTIARHLKSAPENALVHICAFVETTMREAVEAQRQMMECGHPAAALNHSMVDYSDPGRLRTMYCRSCEIQGQKEKSHV
jgi:hypothetical protein